MKIDNWELVNCHGKLQLRVNKNLNKGNTHTHTHTTYKCQNNIISNPDKVMVNAAFIKIFSIEVFSFLLQTEK